MHFRGWQLLGEPVEEFDKVIERQVILRKPPLRRPGEGDKYTVELEIEPLTAAHAASAPGSPLDGGEGCNRPSLPQRA